MYIHKLFKLMFYYEIWLKYMMNTIYMEQPTPKKFFGKDKNPFCLILKQ